MSRQTSDDPCDPLTRLEQRIERTLEQCRRFEQMAPPLLEWAENWSVTTLARWLNMSQLPLGEREKALVGLALKGSREAGAVINDYDPSGEGQAHRLFYRVVRIEWEQCHRERHTRDKAI